MIRLSKAMMCLLALLATATLGGCSNTADQNDGPAPQNKEEALAKLSAAHKQNFESWKSKVVKSCDSAEAFGLNKDSKLESDGIDGAALIQANDNSLLFSENGSFAIVTGFNSFSGSSTLKTEQTVSVNGQSYSIKAETKREGSNCVVYLFGQKVHEAQILRNLVIGAHWAPGKKAEATSLLPVIRPLGASGMNEAVRHGVFSVLSQSLVPAKEASALVSRKLGMSEQQTAQLIQLSNYMSAGSSVRLENEPSAVWSNQEGANLIARASALQAAFDGNPHTLPLEVRLAIPQYTFIETKNIADGANLKLSLDVLVARKDNAYTYATQALELQGLMPFDKEESVQCAKDRAMAYMGGPSSQYQIDPTVAVMFSPCGTLFPDIEKTSYENGLMRSLVPHVFANVTPSMQFQYGGWDQVLSRLALEALDQGKSIRAEIDPSSKTRLVGIVADHLEALKQEMARTKSMSQAKAAIYQTGLDWSFKGFLVSPLRMGQILQSLDNTIDTFKASSERLLGDLGGQPNGYDDQLAFAQNMDMNYKSSAMQALTLAKELSYAAYEQDVHNQVIQKKLSIDELRDWTSKFTTIKTEINKFSNLGAVKGDLTGLSIKWLKSGETTAQGLPSIYASIDNAAVPFETSTKTLVQDLGQSLINNMEALNFAKSLTPEYKQLATSIRDNSEANDYKSWGQTFFDTILQKRPPVQQLHAWDEMWKAAWDFTQSEKIKTMNEPGSTNEWNRKKVIEVAVTETWLGADFAGLISIAEVARFKNTCDRYNGASSLADCGGMSLFSKQKGKFLDPALGGRYVALSKDFVGYMNLLSASEWTTLRWSMIGEFFGPWDPIWSKCEQTVFNQKNATLKTQVNAIAKEKDQFKKWELERQIKETIKNCQ